MSFNPYAAPTSERSSTVHRLAHWKTKWFYGAIVLGGGVLSLLGVTSSAVTLGILLVWAVIFGQKVAAALNEALSEYSSKRVPKALTIAPVVGPAIATAMWLVLRSSDSDMKPLLIAMPLLLLVGKVLYFVFMLRVDACAEEILALQARAAEETPLRKPRKKKKKSEPVEADLSIPA